MPNTKSVDRKIALLRRTYVTLIRPYAPDISLKTWLAMEHPQRRAVYQRAYYQTHIEAAKEYQREYNSTHHKSKKLRRANLRYARERTHTEVHRYNITSLSTPHFERMLENILSGKCTLW